MSEVKPDMILTPSLAVIMFTMDTEPEPTKLDCCRQTFGKSPWKFHHTTELNTSKQASNRVHVRQEFYELMPYLPLFSMSPLHFGKQILRINVFTYNHDDMVKFYSLLFGVLPTVVREDFCYFQFNHSKSLTIQLSLKGGRKLMPYPTGGADIKVTVSDLPSHFELLPVSDGTQRLKDPDSNILVIVNSQNGLTLPEQRTSTQYLEHPPKHYSDDLIKSKELVLETKVLENGLSEARPDVIPKEDNVYASIRPKTRPSGPTIRKLGRSRSPANPTRKLVFQTKSTLATESLADELNNNSSILSRKDSVDIVASF